MAVNDRDMAQGQSPQTEVQVAVKFTTKLPASLRVPPSTVTVPGNLTRYGLSQIINHLLALDIPRPFDFLIRDELLRLSLHEHMALNILTAEAVLEIEYVPAVLPPTPKEEHPHDDWISSLANVSKDSENNQHNIVAAGCYDGVVRLWENDSCIASFIAHKGAVKASACVNDSSTSLLLTGGDDCSIKAWQLSAKSASSKEDDPSSSVLLATFKGHTASITSIAPINNNTKDRCATTGWDGRVNVYRCGQALVDNCALHDNTDDDDENDAYTGAARKKRKGSNNKSKKLNSAGQATQHEEHPISSLAWTQGGSGDGAHLMCTSAVVWPSPSVLITSSWDHSVKVWDPEVSAVVDSYFHNKAVHCIATHSGASPSASVIAFGGPEKDLRLWDRRNSNKTDSLTIKGLISHTSWISALAWHPHSEHHVASVSHDGALKLWDTRAAVPLHSLETGDDNKLLCCAWLQGKEIAYGGSDSVLRTATIEV